MLEIYHSCAHLNFIRTDGTWASAVLLRRGTAGLRKDSVVLCHQVTTLDRAKLLQRIGTLSSLDIGFIEDGLKAAMDLD